MIDFRLASAGQVLDELGARLRQQRQALNWTQQELATRAHVALNAVKALESGGNTTMTSMVKVAQTLGVIGDLAQAFAPKANVTIAELERAAGATRIRVRKARPQ